MMKNEFEYILLTPLERVGMGGNFVDADRLIFSAPSKKLSQYTAKIKQGMQQSEKFLQVQVLGSIKDYNAFLEKAQEQEKNANNIEKSTEERASEIINQIMASNVNWHEFEECFKQICINGCCSVNGQTPMTVALYEKLSDKDGDKMLGLYLANFFS